MEYKATVNIIETLCDFSNNNYIMKEVVDCSFWTIVDQFKSSKHVQESIEIIRKCYHEYGPDNVFLSFNGGKDCTVLLYLTIYVLRTTYPNYKSPLLCLYIKSQNPFPEVENFIARCVEVFNLEIITYVNDVKAGVDKILKSKCNLKACLMGTRRTDPYSEHLNHFQMTDAGWPQVMRVSPILDWKYSEIWEFLLITKASYCDLYDQGYTSLGNKSNTKPNPALRYVDSQTGEEKYLPAWHLKDESKERCGRARL